MISHALLSKGRSHTQHPERSATWIHPFVRPIPDPKSPDVICKFYQVISTEVLATVFGVQRRPG